MRSDHGGRNPCNFRIPVLDPVFRQVEEAKRLTIAIVSQLQMLQASASQTLQDLQQMRYVFRSSLSVYIQLRWPEEQVQSIQIVIDITYNLNVFDTMNAVCFQNVVLLVCHVRGDKLLLHFILRMLLHRD